MSGEPSRTSRKASRSPSPGAKSITGFMRSGSSALPRGGKASDIIGAWCFEILAWIAASIHDQSRAASLLGVAHAIADAMGVPTAIPPYLVRYHQECERQARGALGEEAFESAFERGMGLSPADAVAYATKPTLENEPPRLA